MNRHLRCAACTVLMLAPAFWPRTAPAAPGDAPTTAVTAAVASEKVSVVGLPENRPSGLAAPASALNTAAHGVGVFDPKTMMRPEDVRPGMKGYGLSVFSGIRPEKFGATVVAVRHRVFPGQDIILCQLDHPVLKDIGVIAGMSGSPVYIEDKLIGAVAYGWTNAKEALAGVTPIDAMLDVYASTREGGGTEGASRDAAGGFEQYEAYMKMRRDLQVVSPWRGRGPAGFDLKAEDVPGLANLPGTIPMQPLSTPLYLSTASPATLDLARRFFDGLPVVPVSGGIVSAPSAPAQNSPGGPVTDLKALADEVSGGWGLAIPMVEGDMNMAGVGTVTWRSGGKLVAFGHPMFQFGAVEFPMAPARINALVRNSVRPFKVGESLGQVGMIRQDRLPAVGGVFGETARMVPVRASVEDVSYAGRRQFQFRVLAERDLVAGYAMLTLAESIASAGRSGGDTAATFRYSIAFDDGTTFTKDNYVADGSGGVTAAVAVASDLGVLAMNPYKRVRPTSAEMDIRLSNRLPQAAIVRATTDRPQYRPGDTVRVGMELQPYRKPPQRLQYEFRLPANLPDGEYSLGITDSSGRTSVDMQRNPGGEKVFDFDSLMRLVRRNYPRNKVYVTLRDSDTGATVRGSEMPKLPGSVIGTLSQTVDSPDYAAVNGNFLVDADIVTGYEIEGGQGLTVRVSRRIE